MKKQIQFILTALALLALPILNFQFSTALAQGSTAFTFQGRLNTAGGPATGSYDMMFSVWDANIAGDLIAGPVTNSGVAVSNGLFTVTLDFGPGVFTGTNYWVQMAVSPAGANTFSTLVPRQQLTPAPYALSLIAPQSYSLCPPGSIMAYMGTAAPPGWLMCDGSAVSRTNFAALFAVLGTSCGQGDSNTTFNLPDCRGVFLRGANGTRSDSFADPDDNSAFRTAINVGGNTGNSVGSYQQDMFKSHDHQTDATPIPPSGQLLGTQNPIYAGGGGDDLGGGGNMRTGFSGGDETRPKNIYVNYIIKY